MLSAAEPVSRETIWRIDGRTSSVVFELRALAVVGIEGRIGAVAGEVWRDAEGEWVQVRVPLSRLKMSSDRRRRWALSEEFFDAARNPELTFTARLPAGKAISEMRGNLRGTLRLRGIEAPQQVELAEPHCGKSETRCLIIAKAKVSRSRFGMRSRSIVLSDTVELALRLELEQAPAASP